MISDHNAREKLNDCHLNVISVELCVLSKPLNSSDIPYRYDYRMYFRLTNLENCMLPRVQLLFRFPIHIGFSYLFKWLVS